MPCINKANILYSTSNIAITKPTIEVKLRPTNKYIPNIAIITDLCKNCFIGISDNAEKQPKTTHAAVIE